MRTSWTSRAPEPVKAALRPVRAGYRRVTAGLRALPDFQILGAMKCGTSSLFQHLVEHPAICDTADKEIHFFDVHYARGPAWYRGHFPLRVAGRRCGEASPYYLHHPLAAERMARLTPQARLIVLLRDPVARLLSHYQHNLRWGYETLPLAEALAREEERTAGEEERILAGGDYQSFAHRYWTYRAKGLYAAQLERWLRHFPREQLLVLRSEDFFADPAAVVDRAFAFLGLPAHRLRSYAAANVGGYDAPIEAGLERELRAFFRPHNARLARLVGLDFGWDR